MRIIGRLLVLSLVAGFAGAQAPAPAPPADAAAATAAPAGIDFSQPAKDAPVHDELRALAGAMEEALNERDLDGLLANVDDDLVFTAMNAETGYGKEHVRDYFNRMLNGPEKVVENIKVDFVPDKLAVFYGPDVAVSGGRADSHYDLANGMKFDVPARWTGTLVRKQGKWLVAAFHYSTNMFDNPVLDAQRKFMLLAGGGSALVLAIIGFIIGRRTGRRAPG